MTKVTENCNVIIFNFEKVSFTLPPNNSSDDEYDSDGDSDDNDDSDNISDSDSEDVCSILIDVIYFRFIIWIWYKSNSY